MRLLERARPDRDTLVVEVRAVPRERLSLRPGFHHEVPRLGHAGARVGQRDAVGEKLLRHAADEARDDAAAGHDVEHRDFLGEPKRVRVQRRQIAEDADLDALGPLGEHRGDQVR
jgi:hypothetical protein